MKAGWSTASLGEIFKISRGGSPRPIEDFITDQPDGLNWVKIGDASASGKFIERTKEKIRPEGLSKTRFVVPGDFLLTNSMSFGRPYIMATNGCIHDGWLVLKPLAHSAVHPDYFYYLLGSDSVYAQFASRAGGSTVKNLNSEIVASVEVSLPPFSEQQRIASILDKADALRRKRRHAVNLLDGLKQAVFSDMFGAPSSNPKGLRKGIVGDLLESTQYGTSAKAGSIGTYPILRMGNIGTTGQISTDELKYINLEDTELSRYTLQKGDILFNRTNSIDLIGKTAVFDLDETYAFAGYLVRARARRDASSKYISGYLNSIHGKKTLRGMAKSIVGMANINAREMQNIPILIPSKSEQMRYEKRVEAIDLEIGEQGKSLVEIDALFSSLQHRAFTGRL